MRCFHAHIHVVKTWPLERPFLRAKTKLRKTLFLLISFRLSGKKVQCEYSSELYGNKVSHDRGKRGLCIVKTIRASLSA